MASGDTIDRIAISISADADAAVKSIDKLSASLKSLQSATSSVKSLQTVASALKGFTNATKGLDLSAFSKIKLSKTTVTNLTGLSTALKAIPSSAASNLSQVATALTNLGNAKTITAAKIKNLQSLAPALRQMESANMASLVSQFNQLASALTRLTPQIQTLGSSSSQFASSMRSVTNSAKNMASATQKVTKASGEATTAMTKWQKASQTLKVVLQQLSPISLINRITMFKAAIMSAVNSVGYFINKSNAYIENANLFEAAMGSSTEAATEFGLKAQSLLGIDFNDWMRNQGVFQTLATGMGVTSEKASVMSQQLTQLGYDISSFYNISVEDAMLKLQSGLAGELEPLRRIGWDLSVARMNAELAAKGFDANANSMTQAEKVALRYEMIMNQVTITHGDMARTIMAPANSIRVFQAQLQIAARSIGNLFIPMLSAIIPVAIGVVQALTWAAQAIAKLFNIDASFDIDYSSLDTSGIASGLADTATDAADAADAVGDVADATSDATKKAKEYKNTVMGFDELNKLNDVSEDTTDPSSGSGGSGGGSAGGGGIGDIAGLPTYDFFEGLAGEFNKLADQWGNAMAKAMKVLIPIAASVAAALKAWSIIKTLQEMGMLKDLVGVKLLKTIAGIGIAFAGLTVIIINAIDAWANGLDSSNFAGLLAGVALLVAGLGIAFGTVGAVIGAVIGGVVLVVVGLHDAVENGFNAINSACIAVGIAVASIAAGFGAFAAAAGSSATIAGVAIAGLAGPIGIAVAALVALAGITIVGVTWGLQDCAKSVDALGDVSEETRDRFGSSVTSMEDMQKSLKEHQFGQDVIDEGDVAWVQEKTQDIHDTIVNNLDSKRNEELANLDSLAGTLSDEKIQELKDKTNQYYDEMKATEEAENDEIYQIYKTAAEKKEALGAGELARLSELQENQRQRLVEVSTETQEEINSINQKMHQNNEAEALQSAQKVIQNAITERDETIQAANDTYNGIIAEADKLKQAGLITDEEYQAMTQAAETNRDASIDAANQKWTDISTSTEQGLGDAKNKIDMSTGEIKSNFDILGENIQGAFEIAKSFVIGIWNTVSGWFWDNVIQPVIDFFNNCKDNITNAFNLAKNLVIGVWNTVSGWFDSTVVQPIRNVFEWLKNTIGSIFEGAWNLAKKPFEAAWNFFNGVASTIQNIFWGVVNYVGGVFSDLGNTIQGVFDGIISAIKWPINTVIGAINSINFDIPDWVPVVGGSHIGFNIPYLAKGGMVDKGQLFVAREAGPEMVGTIGGKTAVANNEQIITGIQQGVAKAILNVAPVFNGSNNNDETTVVLKVGNEELARAVARGNSKLANRGFVSFA